MSDHRTSRFVLLGVLVVAVLGLAVFMWPRNENPPDPDTPGNQTPAAEATTTSTYLPTTTVPPITTTLPEYGVGQVGPAWEQSTTDGTLVDETNFPGAIESASPGETVLIAAGEYRGGFTVPEGVTVKPYGGALVQIDGSIGLESGATVAGLRLITDNSWVIRVDSESDRVKSNITVRNNAISGGEIEAIRVSRNVTDVVISGNDISGGGNHNIKVHGEGSGYKPSATIRNNRIHDAVREDGIQVEDSGTVVIEHNTISGAPENGIDIKTGDVTVSSNVLSGSTFGEVALLVHGEGRAVVSDNEFADGAGVMLGSRETGDPGLELRDNVLDGGEVTLRLSFSPAIVQGNSWLGGLLQLGWTVGDHPRAAQIVDNDFSGTEFVDVVTEAGDTYVCTGNTMTDTTGVLNQCSDQPSLSVWPLSQSVAAASMS